MIKNERELDYQKEGNNNNKNVINNRYNNIKSNSPILTHQNNYYYNTKINHLVLQGPSNNNRETKFLQPQQHPLYNSVYINYDFVEKNQNNESNTLKAKELNNSLNKNIIDTSNTNRNMLNRYSKSFLENSNNNISIHKKYVSNNKYNKNNYNPFQVLNYLKKKKHTSNNIYYLVNKDLKNQNNNDNYDTNLSNSHLSKSGIYKTNNTTYIESLSNNKHYFYNIQNSKNKSNKKNGENNIKGYRRIPLKNDKVGNYSIKSPGMINSKKNLNKYSKINKINIDKKGCCKSPEIFGKNKTKYIALKNSNNIETNNNSKEYNSGMGFYKKNNEAKTKSCININNIRKQKNILNYNKKDVNINNNNIHKNSIKNKNNNIYKSYIIPTNIDDNTNQNNEKKMNMQKDIYIKINPKNYRLVDNNIKNNNGNESPTLGRERKMNNVANFKNYIKYQILEFNIKNNIELFCDILEQFYYNSFKNFYNFFIQRLISFAQQNSSKRAVILRRIKDGKKESKTNIKINNTSKINLNKTINKEINAQRKNGKSPSKFVELKTNIMPSVMKINQDNYIAIFNEIFKRQEKDQEDKKCRSPIIEKNYGNIRMLEDSLDLENKDEKFDKYQTNTNVISLYYPKKNLNLKLNVDLINKNNNDTITNNAEFEKNNLRGSLSTDNKKPLLNKNSNIKTKKYINYFNYNYNNKNITNTDNNNIIKKYEYDTENKRVEPIENTIYYDNKIFQNQKYIITNSPEPLLNRDNSDKRIYNKVEQTQASNNYILYSKPLLKKTMTKDSDANNNSNNINTINLRNNLELKDNNNISHSHNLINVNTKLSKAYYYNNQKSIFDNLNIKDESNPLIIDQNNNKYGEIIIKNVCTKDEQLHVFIKYIDIGNNSIKNKNNNGLNKKLISKHTDSISLINDIKYKKNIKNKSFIKSNINNNENDFDNINIERNPFYKYNSARNSKYGIYEHNNITKVNLAKILTKRDEENDEPLKINNSFIEENNKINEDIKNSIIYLINFLQNMYNDNKKLVLFNFFKNLRKIKTNALLHNSIKTRGKQKLKKNAINIQRNNNKKVIEINNFNNYKILNSSNRSHDIKINNNKTSNIKSSVNSKVTRNKEKDNYLNKPKLDDEIFKSNYKTNNKNNKNNNNEDYFNNKKYYSNTSFNKSNKKNNNTANNSLYNDNNNINKNDLFLGDSKEKTKNKDENAESKEKNINMEEKNNQKLKEMKLAKLGKIFKNLEQENNIISAIKEQFLEWSNNNNLRKSGKENVQNEEDNNNKKKKYGIKTFDMKCMFNNPFYDENNKMKNFNKDNDLEDIIQKFKNKLIIYSLNNNKKRNFIKVNKIDIKKYGGEGEKGNKIKFN